MGFFSALPNLRALCAHFVPDAAVFCGVLEFHEDGMSDSRWTVSYCGAGGLGFCGLSVSGTEAFVYAVYRADVDALSGDDAVQLSGATPSGTVKYSWLYYFAGDFFCLSGIFDLPGFLQLAKRADRGGEDRRGGGVDDLSKDRAASCL